MTTITRDANGRYALLTTYEGGERDNVLSVVAPDDGKCLVIEDGALGIVLTGSAISALFTIARAHGLIEEAGGVSVKLVADTNTKMRELLNRVLKSKRTDPLSPGLVLDIFNLLYEEGGDPYEG